MADSVAAVNKIVAEAASTTESKKLIDAAPAATAAEEAALAATGATGAAGGATEATGPEGPTSISKTYTLKKTQNGADSHTLVHSLTHSDRPAADKLDLERDAAERAELQRILDQVDLADDRIFATVFNASERKAWGAAWG